MLVHADNFNYYGTDTNLFFNGVYADKLGDNPGTIVADPDGTSVPKVLKTTSGSGNRGLRWVLPAAVTTCGVGRRLWMDSLPSDTTSPGYASALICDFRDGSNNVMGTVWVTTTGAIAVTTGTSGLAGTLVAQSSGPAITANGWFHIEVKYHQDAAAGTVEVRVEGVTVINASSLNTGASNIAQVGFGNTSSGAGVGGLPCYTKDLVVWDGTGSQNNDFLGSVIVYELLTTADDTFPWTSTDADGFSVLDNNPPDDTTHYIHADYPAMPAAAKFDLSDLPADVTSVKALVTRVRAWKSDGGDGQLQVGLISGVSTDTGADRPITTTPTYWTDVSELDPATSTAWSPTAANAALLQLDRTV